MKPKPLWKTEEEQITFLYLNVTFKSKKLLSYYVFIE